MTNVHLRTSNGFIRVKGHAHGPNPVQRASPRPVALSSDRRPRADVSHCLDEDVKPALFRMHESESWGQVHQSVKEGGGRRQDGGIEAGVGWAKRKERRKVNGFMAAVIIRLDENHFISRRAEGMLGNDLKQVFQASEAMMQSDVPVSLNVCRRISVLNMKGTSLWLRRVYVNYY